MPIQCRPARHRRLGFESKFMMITRIIPTVVCVMFILGSGIVHGLWTSRWYPSKALQQAVSRVPKVPMEIGEWKATDVEVDAETYAQAGAQGYWMRNYRHDKTGERITVILMCGPFGQMSVHTPDVCYRGAGYEMDGGQRKVVIRDGDTEGHFWSGVFRKNNALSAPALHLYWSWSADGDWLTPSSPRFTFRGRPALYKLYVIQQETVMPESKATQNEVQRFIGQLLPQLKKSLFSKEAV